jgi:hypothetical protein
MENLWEAYKKKDFKKCWWILSGLNSTDPTDVLVVAPFYYRNEPVFGPSLVSPLGVSVTCLIPIEYFFPTSLLRFSGFPWTLQIDVDLTALFVRQVMLLMRPKMVITSDDAGILVLARLGSKLGPSSPLLDCFKRSMTWPVVYPPPSLSKLIQGHENFAPKEVVVSESDGLHWISLDGQRLEAALETLNTSMAYVKREYSKDSKGVQLYTKANKIGAGKVFFRQEGVEVLDLDLKVRLFLQEPARPSVAIGARFFATQGEVIGMALSERTQVRGDAAVRYITRRNPVIEQHTLDFVRAINYTGFGATWWWPTWKNQSEWVLIDFNARIERHACLGPILPESERENDPCIIFQKHLRGEKLSGLTFVAENIEYRDPIRLAENKFFDDLLCNSTDWNINSADEALWEFLKKEARCEEGNLNSMADNTTKPQ